MEATEALRAVATAISVAAGLDLTVSDAIVLNDSNRLVVRLLPCDIVARVSPLGWFSAAGEVELARRLGEETDCPVAGLDPRVEPQIVVRDGFEVTIWTYFEPMQSGALPPGDYAFALERLHGAMRRVDMSAPHFTDRLAEIQRWLADGYTTPDLTDEDRELLLHRLDTPMRSLNNHSATEQLLHGEPHPWNVLTTKQDFSSSTSRTAPAGRSSSTLHGFPPTSAGFTGTLTSSWSTSAEPSYWRSSQRTAGDKTTNTRAADSQEI